MAQRQRYRFALLTVFSAESQIFAGSVASAIRENLLSNWGEFSLGSAGSGIKVVFLDSLDQNLSLAILRFPRDFQVQILSSAALLLGAGDAAAAVRVHLISGRLRNSASAGIEFSLRWKKMKKLTAEPPLVAKLRALPDYL